MAGHFKDKPTASSIDGNELLWLLDDPSGTPADVKATVDAAVSRAFVLPGFGTAVDARVATAQQTVAAPVSVTSGTRALAAADLGLDFILAAASTGISGSATSLGNGFTINLINESGSNYTLPTLTGATNRYPLGASHTQLAANGEARLLIYTVGATRYARWSGDTV